jgi:hypothetical protein
MEAPGRPAAVFTAASDLATVERRQSKERPVLPALAIVSVFLF